MSSIKLKQRTGSMKLKQRTGRIEKANVITARDTEATYFDKNGILQTAAPHEVRYSKNFDTGQQELLLEDESTNLVESIDNWSGDMLKQNDNTYKISHLVRSNQLFEAGDGKTYNRSIFIRNINAETIEISTQFNGYAPNLTFDFGSLNIEYGIFNNLNVEILPGAWYRISFSQKNITQNWNSNRKIWFTIKTGGPKEILIKYPQCERGNTPSTPIITQDEPVTRPADKLVFAT